MKHAHDEDDHEPDMPMRDRWPKGLFGALAYFVDHCVFRFNRPVDWHAARAAEESSDGYADWYSNDFSLLTKSELTIFTLMARGLTDTEIAVRLGLPAASGQRRECGHVFKEKLGIHHQADIIELASKHGLI